MKIDTNETKMLISENLWDILKKRLGVILLVILFYSCILAMQWDFSSDSNPEDALAIPMIILLFFLVFLDGDHIYQCELDQVMQKAIIEKRAGWYLWIPRKLEIPFRNIDGIILSQEKNQKDSETSKGVRMEIKINAGLRLPFATKSTIETGEIISEFLRVPLLLEMGSETATIIPWDVKITGNLSPTPCPKCGAPLPIIQPPASTAVCEHCGMTFIVRWEKDGPLLHDLRHTSQYQLKK